MAFLRPIRSERKPKTMPPTIAPMLATMLIQLTVDGIEVVLFLQEGGIEVLRAVAEEVEQHHHHDGIDDEAPIVGEGLPEAGLGLFLRLDESRRFLDAGADEQHDEGRQHAEQEHHAPVDDIAGDVAAVEQAVDDRGEQEAAGVAGLQQARDRSARVRRDRFHDQRTAQSPFAAHGDAEQGAQDEENCEVGRKRRRRADDGIAEDVDHQRRLAADPVADLAEDEGADETHGERQEQRIGDFGNVDAESPWRCP